MTRQERIAVLRQHYLNPIWGWDNVREGEQRFLAVSQLGPHNAGVADPEAVYFYSAETEEEAFETLADEILEGRFMEAVYDLDTGERIELHVSTPVVSRAEDQGVMVNPLAETVS